jgi:hypothetical protein
MEFIKEAAAIAAASLFCHVDDRRHLLAYIK